MTTLNRLTIASMLILTGLLTGCATVSFDQPKSCSIAITGTGDTAPGKYAGHIAATHAGASGFYPLDQGMDALGVRLRLAESTTKSIDLQYFLMKSDTAGAVRANALLKAADRGGRVRFLLDDAFTSVSDDNSPYYVPGDRSPPPVRPRHRFPDFRSTGSTDPGHRARGEQHSSDSGADRS